MVVRFWLTQDVRRSIPPHLGSLRLACSAREARCAPPVASLPTLGSVQFLVNKQLCDLFVMIEVRSIL